MMMSRFGRPSASLLRSQGLLVKGFVSKSEVLAESFSGCSDLLILDVHLKKTGGLDLQNNLNLAGGIATFRIH
jgi:FixJ family two-component response regulator